MLNNSKNMHPSPLTNNSAILVYELSKIYKLYVRNIDRLKEAFHPTRKKYHRDFYALKDISLNISRGETIGIIGRNGSGKSTFLQIVTGVLTPSSGTMSVNGRISALLELGSGFNPQFTGMENIFFNGQIMGYSRKEIERRIDDILSFADIGEFIHQPVRTYSSGMFVRLAFSLAVSVEPEILIVDEALAVGDTAFQMKCMDKINQMIEKGVTLLFVSHDPGAIKRLCRRAILLDKGKVVRDSNPEEVFDLYNAMIADENFENTLTKKLDNGKIQTISGTGKARVVDLQILNKNKEKSHGFETGETVTIKTTVETYEDIETLVFGFMIKDRMGQVMFGTNTFHTKQTLKNIKSGEKYCFNIIFNMNLGIGDYSITTALTSNDTHVQKNYEWKDYAAIFKVVNNHNILFVGSNWIPVNIVIESG